MILETCSLPEYLVLPLLEDSGGNESPEPCHQHVGGDAEVGLEAGEPSDSAVGYAKDQQ